MRVYKDQTAARKAAIKTLKEYGITLEWRVYGTTQLLDLAEEQAQGDTSFFET